MPVEFLSEEQLAVKFVAGELEIGDASCVKKLRSTAADATRLSPLGHAAVNCLGRYAFSAQPAAELRPLGDPDARDSEDDGEL
jgi:hypothetical protein